jgi:hypothetical protein
MPSLRSVTVVKGGGSTIIPRPPTQRIYPEVEVFAKFILFWCLYIEKASQKLGPRDIKCNAITFYHQSHAQNLVQSIQTMEE